MGVEGNIVAHLARMVVNWTGFTGAPGFTNLYFRNSTPGTIDQAVVDNAKTKVEAWIVAVRAACPAAVLTGLDPTIGIIDDTNGELQGYMSVTVAAPAGGGATGNYSAASGGVANWSTGTVRNGRRIRGRSFMVPLGGSALDADGSLNSGHVTNLRTAATALHAATGASRFVIWARPTAPGATDGGSAEVISSTVPDKVAVLTSRRD